MNTAYQIPDSVKCSAGRGEIEKSACLECALNRKNTCGYDYYLLKYLLHQPARTGIHVTDLTGCLRKAFYTRQQPKLEFVHELLLAKLGTAVHASLEAKDTSVFSSEFRLDAFGIVGTADVYYKSGRIMDTKTTRWLTPSKLPYGSHAMQVNIYAAMLREMGELVTSAAIQYIDMSGPYKCKACNVYYEPSDFGVSICPSCGKSVKEAHLGAAIFEIPLLPHDEIVALIKERRDVLLTALDIEIAPRQEQGFLCNYCAHSKICLG